jgi:hypothetical protein
VSTTDPGGLTHSYNIYIIGIDEIRAGSGSGTLAGDAADLTKVVSVGSGQCDEESKTRPYTTNFLQADEERGGETL